MIAIWKLWSFLTRENRNVFPFEKKEQFIHPSTKHKTTHIIENQLLHNDLKSVLEVLQLM